MTWSSPGSLPTSLLAGTPFAILITILVTLTLPLLLHLFLYRSAASTTALPTFVLLGPSGSGKTSFLTLLERASTQSPTHQRQPQTRISQAPLTVHITLGPQIPIASTRFRSQNDSSLQSSRHRQLALIDTPGHGKLRAQHGLSLLSPPPTKKSSKLPSQKILGVIFFTDSAFPSGDAQIRDTAEYLHDVLLSLQKRALIEAKGRTKKDQAAITNVLVAANKQDLFTALPPATIKGKLEKEIDIVRKTRARGLLDSGITVGADGDEVEEKEGLGRGENFSFRELEDDTGVRLEVVGGSARGDEGAGVRRWEEWIGGCL